MGRESSKSCWRNPRDVQYSLQRIVRAGISKNPHETDTRGNPRSVEGARDDALRNPRRFMQLLPRFRGSYEVSEFARCVWTLGTESVRPTSLPGRGGEVDGTNPGSGRREIDGTNPGPGPSRFDGTNPGPGRGQIDGTNPGPGRGQIVGTNPAHVGSSVICFGWEACARRRQIDGTNPPAKMAVSRAAPRVQTALAIIGRRG
jgi:hypothetical protein